MAKKSRPAALKIDLPTFYLCHVDLSDHASVVELFDALGYDLTNPQHWIWLIATFAAERKARQRGRPQKWTPETRRRLFVDLMLLKKAGHEAEGRHEQAKLLKEHYKLDPLYKNASEDEIYKNLLKFFREMEAAILAPSPQDEEEAILRRIDDLAEDDG